MMSFNIETGKSNASFPLRENNRNKLQSSSCSLAGREVAHYASSTTEQVKIKTIVGEKLLKESEEEKQTAIIIFLGSRCTRI